ncbi:MAG: nicotinate-nucleotide adenylyltransferase [Candidatus Omnitrophota bacterium]
MKKKIRIGILGGTFNPPHLGHIALAREAARQLELDKVIFIPALLPPHKTLKDNNPSLRYKMAALACRNNPLFEISTIELDRNGISYSVDTLRELKKIYGASARFFFLTGSDSLKELKTWKESKKLLKLTYFVVAKRPGFPMRGTKRGMTVLNAPLLDISSSVIRKRVKKSLSIKQLVPEAVRKFIKDKGLYK